MTTEGIDCNGEGIEDSSNTLLSMSSPAFDPVTMGLLCFTAAALFAAASGSGENRIRGISLQPENAFGPNFSELARQKQIQRKQQRIRVKVQFTWDSSGSDVASP